MIAQHHDDTLRRGQRDLESCAALALHRDGPAREEFHRTFCPRTARYSHDEVDVSLTLVVDEHRSLATQLEKVRVDALLNVALVNSGDNDRALHSAHVKEVGEQPASSRFVMVNNREVEVRGHQDRLAASVPPAEDGGAGGHGCTGGASA